MKRFYLFLLCFFSLSNQHLLISAAKSSTTSKPALPTLPSWDEQFQELAKKEIRQLFAGTPLQPLDELEKEIVAEGSSAGIKNWSIKFDRFKTKIVILKGFIQQEFKVRIFSPSNENNVRNSYSFGGEWYPILTLVGLKPVTTEEDITEKLEPFLKILADDKSIKTLTTKDTQYLLDMPIVLDNYKSIKMVTDPLIPLSKMMQWYDKKSFLDLSDKIEEAQKKETIRIYKQLQSDALGDVQDKNFDVLWQWDALFASQSEHSANLAALFLGYQPFTYQRFNRQELNDGTTFLDNQHAYRFLLNPEYVLLDDKSPYVQIYGKLMEYFLRSALGDELYAYILSSRILSAIKSVGPSQEAGEFITFFFQVKDLNGFDLDVLQNSHMSFFVRNFLIAQSSKKPIPEIETKKIVHKKHKKIHSAVVV